MAAFDTKPPLLAEILTLHGKWKGDKAALICDQDRVSWADFEATTNRIAHALNAQGIGRGAMVGVVMSNSIEMVYVLIGILKSGACSVPINLAVTDAALTAMLDDAGVCAVFTSPDQDMRLAPYINAHPKLPVINSITLKSFTENAPATAPKPGLTGDDPLNVIYSSGTTGMPKGILHTHAGRRDWAYDLAIALRYHSSARTLFTIGLYSNISWVGMLCTLLSGGTMVIAPKFDPRETLALIEKHAISHFAMVPIQYQRLMEVPDQADFNLSSIEAVMSCGSPLHADLKAALFARLGPKAVIELFGLTEGVITTLDPEEAEGRMASVGKPLIGTDIKIIGDDDVEVPPGQSGEIVGCGRIVMPGYLNRPDATAEATWVDPNGKAWLRTGDIGQLDEAGYLYIVDRKKDMILSGGQNIYPQDIEAILITHHAINDVAVIGITSERWGETPLAVVVREAGAEIEPDEITQWANGQLGKQQRLSAVVFRDALPRNPNGKILKRELRKIYEGFGNG